MRVLLTGATGLIGRELVHRLLSAGHEVRALARTPEKLKEVPKENVYQWSDHEIPQSSCFENCEAVIHLAGEGIADKFWTKKRKERLWNSRVSGTRNLVSAISNLSESARPKILFSGSAIGIYGSSDQEKTEKDTNGSGFLADLCKEWENEANKAMDLGLRVINLRTGLVLSRNGGILAKTGPVILGRGKQWMSWIHIDDWIEFILFALESNELSGPFNLTAPNPVSNSEFTKSVTKAKGYPFTIKVPEWVLKAVLGDMAEAVLANQRILPEKAISSRFKFQTLNDAVDELKQASLL